MRDWRLLAIAAVLILDVGAFLHWYDAPGMVVSRAVAVAAAAGSCDEDLMLREGGQDRLIVLATRPQNTREVTQRLVADFADGQLTPESEASLQRAADVQPAQIGPTHLDQDYERRLAAHETWLGGPCMPLANPFQSELRPAGALAWSNGSYRLFSGHIVYRAGGVQLFGSADVLVGLGPDGRLGFEQLREVGTRAPRMIITLFRYAGAAQGGGAVATPVSAAATSDRRSLYQSHYQRVLSLLRRLPSGKQQV